MQSQMVEAIAGVLCSVQNIYINKMIFYDTVNAYTTWNIVTGAESRSMLC